MSGAGLCASLLRCSGCCQGLPTPSVSTAGADAASTTLLLPTPIICVDLFLMSGSPPCWQVCPASQADCRRVEVLINH